MTWINGEGVTRDRHVAPLDRCHCTLKTSLSLSLRLPEQWSSIRIAGDLQGWRTSSRRRGSERERWNCLDEREIVASRVVVFSTTASLGCWTSIFSLPLSLFVSLINACSPNTSSGNPRVLVSRYGIFISVPRCVYLTFLL